MTGNGEGVGLDGDDQAQGEDGEMVLTLTVLPQLHFFLVKSVRICKDSQKKFVGQDIK